jgi:hypothetical protein
VTAAGLQEVALPRRQALGPSLSVLSAHIAEGAGEGDTRLSVEMQSGDVIMVDAHRFDLEFDQAP